MLRIKIAGGAVAGENIVDGSQAVKAGAVKTVLICSQNSAGKKFMARGSVSEPLAARRQRRLGHFCDHGLQIKQFRQLAKSAGRQDTMQRLIVHLEKSLGQVYT